MAYPQPVLPNEEVFKIRKNRTLAIVNSLKSILIWRLSLCLLEIVTGFVFSVHVLIIDAIGTFFDLLLGVCLLFAVYLAAKPPDQQHPFGHGKLEPFMGWHLSLFLIMVGIYVSHLHIHEIFHPTSQPINNAPIACLVAAICALAMFGRYLKLKKCAKSSKSSVMLTEALHAKADAYSSLVAFFTIFLGLFFSNYGHWLDHIGSFAIGLLLIVQGIKNARDHLGPLIDQKPSVQDFETVSKACFNVAGVLGVEKIKIIHSGPTAHVNVDIEVDPVINVLMSHEIAQKVRASIQNAWPVVNDVTVHVEPYYPLDH